MKFIDIEFFTFKNNKFDDKRPVPTVLNKTILFIKIITDDNIVGLGEPSPYILDTKKTILLINEIFINFILGRKVSEIKLILNKIKKYYKDNNILKFIIPVFEQSFSDIESKLQNMPLFDFISEKYNFKKKLNISLYASGGMLFEDQSFDLLIDEAIKAQEMGFFGWKFRPKTPLYNPDHFQRNLNPPNFDEAELIIFIKKLKKILNPDFKIMIDFGKRIKNNTNTSYFLENLNNADLYFVEEPFHINLNKYYQLRNNYSKLAIALGESFFNLNEAKKWIESDSINYLQPDSNMMPISDIMKALDYSKNNKINFILHNWSYPVSMLNNFHIGCSSDRINLVEYSTIGEKIKNDLILEPIKLKNGKFITSNVPGIGCELNEKLLTKIKI